MGSCPIAWIPGETQLGDVLTKLQNPANWWERVRKPLLIPIGIAEQGSLISNKVGRSGTIVKREVIVDCSGIRPYEFCIEPDLPEAAMRPLFVRNLTGGIWHEQKKRTSFSMVKPTSFVLSPCALNPETLNPTSQNV